MKINKTGLELIKSFEGLELKAYICPAGILTIGYGHTRNVKEGSVITEPEAEKLLLEDLQEAELAVNSGLVTVELNENQFSALVSFVFNVGSEAFFESTLLGMLNRGNFQKAADELLRWDKAGDEKLPGLTRRRTMERQLFLT